MVKFPVHCPSCEQQLEVAKLVCSSCETQVIGKYSLPLLMRLEVEEQEFLLQFLLNSGSLKEMANQLGKSYPTVRNKLDDLIEKIKKLQNGE
ncbi:DUF2089 family protein [Sphingobacterium hungaricum]|uniref:DUF2089 family protein n=1 Tax=Sphingobacterium hungaricum TaxID=2082723 RepID=A0A928YPU3_9SPHI|nr:DUF2089 family protein [Sphingobacterium hungaricum]MBE8713531.1 hypothetical protein [Sphingobacterium hungaricum]